MTDPIGPDAAAELAIFDALSAGVDLAPVFQDVPEGTTAPVVILADITGERIGGKGSRSMKLDLTVTTEDWHEARQPLLAIQAQVERALDGRTLLRAGYEISCTFDTSEARQLGPAQYFGTSNFLVFVTPA